MKGVLYMVVKKKEFYCNLGVQTGYAEIKPVLKAVRMPDGTVSSFCQFTLAIPGERTSYTIFCVEELAQQCAESVTPGDYAIAYGRTTCKRDSSGVCFSFKFVNFIFIDKAIIIFVSSNKMSIVF